MGLAWLHGNRRVHRDIKPSNILLNQDGDVKIADFGVAREFEEAATDRTAKDGEAAEAADPLSQTWVGTMTFMSPERAVGSPYSYNTDIWSLGLSVLAFAQGKLPYSDVRGYFDLLEAHAEKPSPELDPADPRFSAEARDFIALCLRKDPKERPSAAQLLRHPFLFGAGERVLALKAARAQSIVDGTLAPPPTTDSARA